MRDVVLIIFVFSVLPFALSRPYVGLLMWAWLGYMNPHRLTYGFAYSFNFVMIAAIVTLIGLFTSKEKNEFPVTGLSVVWILFILWMSFTTIFALNPEGAHQEWIRMVKIQVMILVTLLIMGKKDRINWLVWVIVISIGYFGVKGGIFTIATGGAFRVWGPPGSFIEGNNEVAFALLVILPLMKYLHSISTNKYLKWAMLGSMLFTAAAIIGSYSRGAFLGGATMLFVLWLKSKGKFGVAVVIILVAAIAVNFLPEQWFDRMQTIESYEEDRSAMGRINSWWFAFNLANDRFIGGGFDTFEPHLFQTYAPDPTDFHDAHSIYFEVLGEHGYIGLILFLIMGIMILTTGNRVIKLSRDKPELQWAKELAAMLQVCFVGYATGGAFLGLAYFDLPYHLMALMVLTESVVKKHLAVKSTGSHDIDKKTELINADKSGSHDK